MKIIEVLDRYELIIHFIPLAAMRITGQYKSIMDLIRKLYQSEGWRVFYRGYLANLLGDEIFP